MFQHFCYDDNYGNYGRNLVICEEINKNILLTLHLLSERYIFPSIQTISMDSFSRFFQRFKYQSVNVQQDPEVSDTNEASQRLQISTFFGLGISMLLPWNILILALPFFDDVIPYDFFPSALSAAFTIPNFLTLAFATLTHAGSDLDSRVKRSLMLMTIPLAALGFLAYISTTFKPEFLFVAVLACASSTAVGCAYLQSAGTAVASIYGPAHLKAIL